MKDESRPRVLRRVAAIDVGSNTVRALGAKLLSDRSLVAYHAASKMTALGRGVSETGRIGSKAIADTADFVASFLQECGRLDDVYCVGTAASRDASNTEELRAALRDQTGVELELISPSVEGRLSFFGAIATVEDLPGSAPVVADVGGRSTEMVMREGHSLRAPARASLLHSPTLHVTSTPVGARLLTELYLTSDPPPRAELTAVRRAAKSALGEAITLLDAADALVAVGGTAQSVALLGGSRGEPLPCARERALGSSTAAPSAGPLLGGSRWDTSLSRLQKLRRGLCKLPLQERRRAMAFDPSRAEVICAGMIILEVLAERAPGHRLHISPGGVREGLLITRTGARELVLLSPGSESGEAE